MGAKPGTTPTCRRCGRAHYNFLTCDEHVAEADQAFRGRVIPRWRTSPAGTEPWADRLETIETGTYQRQRKDA